MMKKKKNKAVISDMDGVLVDSFINFYRAYKEIIDRKGVKGFTESYFRYYFGAKGDYTKSAIERDFNVDLGNTNDFMKEKDNNYMKNAVEITNPFTETVKAIKELSLQYKIAVASSSDEKIVNHSLKSIGLTDYIDISVPGNHVSNGKPAPDIFITACERLNIKPENCIVIEDSVPGMIASYKAGIRCICLLADEVDKKKYDKAIAIYRISKLTSDILVNKISELLK